MNKQILFLMLLFSMNLFAYSMEEYIQKHDNLNSFNYKKYLQDTSFSNIEQITTDREIANRKKLGDEFLYKLTDYFIKTEPVTMSNIENHIDIGENFLHISSKNSPKNKKIYTYIGYYILSDASKIVEKTIQENSTNMLFFFKNFFRIKALKIRFGNSKIYIKSGKHKTKKVIDNIRKGNFSYIWNRFHSKYIYKSKTTTKSKITLAPFKIDDVEDKEISYLLNNNKRIGEIIWLENSKYKARYLTDGNVSGRYIKNLKSNNLKPRIVLTGGFANDYSNPEGLTIENGNIINASLMSHRDGLVMIEKSGKITIINVQNGNFTLPNMNKDINPFLYASDYAKLLNWAIDNQVTFFQTQLLAFGKNLLFKKSKSTQRERRLLVSISNNNNKNSQLIVNIREAVQLSVITKKIFNILKTKHYKVQSIVNLDVGAHDVMEVYDANGKKILNGILPLVNAINLLYYTSIDSTEKNKTN